MKALALASLIAASAATGAVVVTTTYHYSSDFQTAQPINGAFNVIESPANIWRVTIDDPSPPNSKTPIVVDINNDGVPDWDHPGIAVAITDIQQRNPSYNASLLINGQTVWSFLVPSSYGLSGSEHFETPIIVPAGAVVEWFVGGGNAQNATLIGRVLNY